MYKLMLADDERIIREGISSIVDWSDMDISLTGVAKNGIEAYEVISKDPPDIVLTDIKMPGMDGLELAKKVRDEYPETAVVVLSGYEEFELARKAMEYGVKHYLLKPCDKDDIIEVMKKILPEIEHRKRKENFVKQIQSSLRKSTEHSGGEIPLRNELSCNLSINRVMRYIEANISDEKLSLSTIAKDILYMDSDYLGKLFKKETGQKFTRYLTKLRMEKAKILIKSDIEYKIAEIAEKVGYGNNPRYFSLVFKKSTGYTPSEYKQFRQ